ncbi:MAG: 2-aminoethylphosphonate--pyruvate transaminase [Hyphomicrobiales bacterium]
MANQPLRAVEPKTSTDMPWLLTPGPLTTSATVKATMLADWGSRDGRFVDVIGRIRKDLLKLANATDGWECVIVQGSGTFAIEAAIGAFAPKQGQGKTLVCINGAYGERAANILRHIGRPVVTLQRGEDEIISPADLASALDADPDIKLVFVVHCETTSGIVNPIAELTRVARERGRIVYVDAMSSFGAIPLDMGTTGIDIMVSSSNKCIEGVPGFSYVLCRRALLESSKGASHSVVLDLFAQWQGLEANGQFRFTPPTHALVAFDQAMKEHAAEGGVAGRNARYRENQRILLEGMRKMGFKTLLDDEKAGPIIQTFVTPADPRFKFEPFYEALRVRGFAIYPGKLTKTPSFRVGTIGQVSPDVMRQFLVAVTEALKELGFETARVA